MLATILFFIGGLVFLLFGANALVNGASKLSMSLGISPLVVGADGGGVWHERT